MVLTSHTIQYQWNLWCPYITVYKLFERPLYNNNNNNIIIIMIQCIYSALKSCKGYRGAEDKRHRFVRARWSLWLQQCQIIERRQWMWRHNNNNRFTALCPGLPGWAGTRRNTHPPTILIIIQSLYQLLLSTTIHSILHVQITCLVIFLYNPFPCPLWSTSWSGALHLIFHTFLNPISVFFSQHMPIPSQPVLLSYQYYIIYS